MKKIIKATIIVSFIRIFDMITTYLGVSRFGIEGELNPILGIQMGIFGNLINSLIFHYFFGIALTYFAFVLIEKVDNHRKRKGLKTHFNKALIVLVIIFSLTVISNLIQVFLT